MSRLISSALGIVVLHSLSAAPKHAGAAKPADAAKPAVEAAGTNPMPQNAGAVAVERAVFAIEDDVPFPSKKVGVKGTSQYPFEKLAVGQSFFVPSTEKVAEPWKTLTSLCSRMTRAHWPKRFVSARTEASGTTPVGVRIWRAPDGEGELPAPKVRAKKETAAQAPENGAGAPTGEATPAEPTFA